MWKWRHFESLDSLLKFVNELELSADAFKIVNSSAPRRSGPYGAPMYLIYREPPDAAIEPTLAAAEELTDEQESALSAAEQILHDATERK
jgi:hypothetical protein